MAKECTRILTFLLLIGLSCEQKATIESSGKSRMFSVRSLYRVSEYHGVGRENEVNSWGSRYASLLVQIDDFVTKLLGSPPAGIVIQSHESHFSQTGPGINKVFDLLLSPDMARMLHVWSERNDSNQQHINVVHTMVESIEMTWMVRILKNENSSTTDKLCAVHWFTYSLEHQQLLHYLNNTSTTQPDRYPFSEVMAELLALICELVNRAKIQTITTTILAANASKSDNSPIQDNKQLSPVSEFTNITTDDLFNCVNDIISSEELAQTLQNAPNISSFIQQLQTTVTNNNITALCELIHTHGHLDEDDKSAVSDIIEKLTDDVQNTLQMTLQFIQHQEENFLRTALTENGVSSGCQDSTILFVEALVNGETWPLRFMDAMGKIPSNLADLPLRWLGSYDECTAIKVNVGENTDVIGGKYCRSMFPIPGATLHRLFGSNDVTIGTCVPSSCSAEDALGAILTAQRLVYNRSTPMIPRVVCIEELPFEADAIIVTCILSVLAAFVLLGTLYDVIVIQKRPQSEEKSGMTPRTGSTETLSSGRSNRQSSASETMPSGQVPRGQVPAGQVPAGQVPAGQVPAGHVPGGQVPAGQVLGAHGGHFKPVYVDKTNTITSDSLRLANNKHLVPDNDIDDAKATQIDLQDVTDRKVDTDVTKTDRGLLRKSLLSFSAYTNGLKILNTQQSSSSLGAINGIRFLSMCWVITGHVCYFVPGFDDNMVPNTIRKLDDPSFNIIAYAHVSVDSFFTISGLLLSFLTLKYLKKIGSAKKVNWFMFYFSRFWRLTPSYMLVMMVGTVLLPYMITGPMTSGKEFPEMSGCRENWWTNLLYINNYVNVYPASNICMEWTWYIANDMQFYVLSPLIFLPLFYNMIAGVTSGAIFLVATLVTTALINHEYEYPAQMNHVIYSPQPRDEYYFQRIYIPSYCRMGPYIIGLFTGYLLYRLDCKCKIPKVLNLLGWLVCLAICCSCVYGLYSYKDDHILTQLQSDLFTSLHRTGWGVAVSWIVFACATGHGGWINGLLSWKAFIPLGRLTYGAYLVHPLVMMSFTSSRRNPTFLSDFEVAYLVIGCVVLSYGTAFIVSLFFESPMMGLQKAFFNKRNDE